MTQKAPLKPGELKMNPLEKKAAPERAGRLKAGFWAVVCLALTLAAAWWLTRDQDEKKAMRDLAAERVNEALDATPFAGLGDVLRASPPPLPEFLLHPPTAPGTLAGRKVEGVVGAPGVGNDAPNPVDPANDANPVFSPEPLPPVTEDSKLGKSYLRELADWLAAKYRPGPRGGSLAVSAQNLNALFGVTIANQTGGGRDALLRYALQPSMVRGLYSLYIDAFMADLDDAAKAKGFDEAKNREFHRAVGGHAAMLAAALSGALETPNLGEKMGAADAAVQNAASVGAKLAEAIFKLDEARTSGAGEAELKTLRLRVDGLAARYRRATADSDTAKRRLADEIRANARQPLDEDALLYVAAWARRRLEAGGDAKAALDGCVAVMRDLARRCDEAAARP